MSLDRLKQQICAKGGEKYLAGFDPREDDVCVCWKRAVAEYLIALKDCRTFGVQNTDLSMHLLVVQYYVYPMYLIEKAKYAQYLIGILANILSKETISIQRLNAYIEEVPALVLWCYEH